MKTITRDQLKNMIDRHDDMLVINVLDKEYYDKAHIPGSLNVPLESNDFIQQVDKLADSRRDIRVITYCASYQCSASTDAAKRLDEAGFKAVFDFKGGIQDWQQADYPVEVGQSRMAA